MNQIIPITKCYPICDSYNWNNQTYTETGTYSYQTQNNDGCDSIAFLELTINNQDSELQTVVACDEYNWNGEI